MNDPWQFLILDRNTATEKDVKGAYARLLKQHRPDQDPEGFKKLREAYEAALGWIAQRNASGEPLPSYAVDSPSGANEETRARDLEMPVHEDVLPEATRASFAEIGHAIDTGNEEQMHAAVTAFHDACSAAQVDAATRAGALRRAFRSDSKLLARGVTDHVMVYLAEEGQVNFCHDVVSCWEQEMAQRRLSGFGHAMLDRRRLLGTPDAAVLMARVGLITGLESPELATALADAAFPHLAAENRTQFIGQVEHQVALGRIFSEVSPRSRPFWLRMLRDRSATRDWSSAEAQRALDDAVEVNRFQWSGWSIVRQLMTAETWASLEQRLQTQARHVMQQSPRAVRNYRWLALPLIFCLLNAIRWIGEQQSTGRRGGSSARAPDYKYGVDKDALMRRLEEFRRGDARRADAGNWNGQAGSDLLHQVDPLARVQAPVVPPSYQSSPNPPAGFLPGAASPTNVPALIPPAKSASPQGGVPSVIDLMKQQNQKLSQPVQPLRGPTSAPPGLDLIAPMLRQK